LTKSCQDGVGELHRAAVCPPVNFTAAEATAMAIALSRPGASPLAEARRSAVRKVVGAMPAAEAEAARQLAGRVHLFAHDSDSRPAAARITEDAVVRSEVVEISYEDRHGEADPRGRAARAGRFWTSLVPGGALPLRDGQRAFRVNRILEARLTGEPAPERGEPTLDGIPVALRRLALLE
jgi:predicted DNA-binding transcriptional regulator YafY